MTGVRCCAGQVHELLFELHGNCQFLDTPLARAFLTKLRTTNQSGEIPFAGELLSWFVAEVLPFSDKERANLLREDSTVARLVAAIELIEHLISDEDVLLRSYAAWAVCKAFANR